MITKEKALDTLNEMPSSFEVEELIEKLIFIEKVEIGLEQLEKGETVSNEMLKQEVKEWRK
ncbi:hypothetical protein SAMN05421640_0947 [Ekhidna lutea]|uniref:Addiction module component n=1 Tax=Ekhidna lutea TaxID=447679 RepID=A0A239GQF7_EKHLU|nr:hypothetical protein [Ekhidna lutea]SNS71018.1 hypothetical protein SAMN05421640_0947 [Ekhidna lutea]